MASQSSKSDLDSQFHRLHPPVSRIKWCLAVMITAVVVVCISLVGETLMNDSTRVGLSDFEMSVVVEESVVRGKKPPRGSALRHPMEEFQDLFTVEDRAASATSESGSSLESTTLNIQSVVRLETTSSQLHLPLCSTSPTSDGTSFGIPYTVGNVVSGCRLIFLLH